MRSCSSRCHISSSPQQLSLRLLHMSRHVRVPRGLPARCVICPPPGHDEQIACCQQCIVCRMQPERVQQARKKRLGILIQARFATPKFLHVRSELQLQSSIWMYVILTEVSKCHVCCTDMSYRDGILMGARSQHVKLMKVDSNHNDQKVITACQRCSHPGLACTEI